MPSRMPETFEELLRLDPASKNYWMGKLAEPKELQTPQVQQWGIKMMSQMLQLSRTSPAALSPQMSEIQRSMLHTFAAIEGPAPLTLPPLPPHLEHLRGTFQSDMRKNIQGLRRTNHHVDVLEPYPQLKLIQWRINGMLDANNEGLAFDMPALLDAIARHLKRPEMFKRIAELTPTEAELIASLEELHSRKPDVHIQLCQLLIEATLIAGPRHNKGCTCPLCAHMAKASRTGTSQHRTFTTASSSSQSTSSRPSGPPRCSCCDAPAF